MTDNTPFVYLLNAMENAGSQPNPAKNGYGEKRKAVLEYVAKIEAEREQTEFAGRQEDSTGVVANETGPASPANLEPVERIRDFDYYADSPEYREAYMEGWRDHAIPPGWTLVPLEPTAEMVVAGWEAWNAPHDPRNNIDCPTSCYRAMLNAVRKE